MAREVLDKYRELNLLYNVSAKLEADLDVLEVAGLVIDQASKLITANRGALILLNQTTGLLETIATFGEGYDRNTTLKPGEGIVGSIFTSGQAEIVNHVSSDPRFIPPRHPVSSLICAPLKTKEGTIGAVVMSSEVPVEYTAADLKLFTALASQAGPAIERAILYKTLEEKVKQRTKQLHQRALQLETLYQVGQALSMTLDLDEVLNLILEHLARIVPYDRAAIFLEHQGNLEVAAARGFPDQVEIGQLRIAVREDALFNQVFQQQQPLAIADVVEWPGWQNFENLPLARSWLGLPLVRLTQVIGMLSLVRVTPSPFGEDELTLAATFAGQAAIALQNARLYDKITRFSHELEEMVRERTIALQEAYDKLDRLDRTKTDFINIASHELRTPVTVLKGYSQMLLKDPAIQANDAHYEQIGQIYQGTLRLHEIVDSMLDVAKIDSRALRLYPEPLSMTGLLELLVARLSPTLAERKLKVVIEDLTALPPLEADQDALRKVFYHLLTNAIKYTPDSGQITISGRCLTGEPDSLEIIIADTGIGIDPQFHELIFAKFYQTGELALHSTGKTKFKGAGPGLGLAIVRGIVEAHNGRVWVESQGYDEQSYPGSQFHVVLPLTRPAAKAAVALPTSVAMV
ncbi:MAG: GAF domain-containing sensor histidine kinase [Anaerolineales bacterium]|nr:GAF domain-containing sensor histidine kinase [Anaerolineales bacterium]